MHMPPPSLRKPNIPPRLGSFCGFDCKAPTSMCSSGEYIQGNCCMVCHGKEKKLKILVTSFLTHLATLVFRSNRSSTSLLPSLSPPRLHCGCTFPELHPLLHFAAWKSSKHRVLAVFPVFFILFMTPKKTQFRTQKQAGGFCGDLKYFPRVHHKNNNVMF